MLLLFFYLPGQEDFQPHFSWFVSSAVFELVPPKISCTCVIINYESKQNWLSILLHVPQYAGIPEQSLLVVLSILFLSFL